MFMSPLSQMNQVYNYEFEAQKDNSSSEDSSSNASSDNDDGYTDSVSLLSRALD